jgi:glucose-6-phosphate isomerase
MGVLDTPEWKALADHYAEVKDLHLRDLFDSDPQRGTTFVAEAGDLYLDYSKKIGRASCRERV